MPRGPRVSAEVKEAVAKVLCGATIRRVSINSGVSRSSIYRHLKAQGWLRDGLRVDPTLPTTKEITP